MNKVYWRKAELLALSQYLLFQTSTSVGFGLSKKETSLVCVGLFWTYPVPPAMVSMKASRKSLSQVDDIIDGIMQYGRGALMAKFDILSVYCLLWHSWLVRGPGA